MKRLRDTMREDLALPGMSANTIDMYVRCARRFAEQHVLEQRLASVGVERAGAGGRGSSAGRR